MPDTAEHGFTPSIGRPATGALPHAGYTGLEQLAGMPEREPAAAKRLLLPLSAGPGWVCRDEEPVKLFV